MHLGGESHARAVAAQIAAARCGRECVIEAMEEETSGENEEKKNGEKIYANDELEEEKYCEFDEERGEMH